ncbi:helicase-associated domain-containing protein [Deinococcus peraridilitoris]|uniref:Helicase XPB/Ssl2 N-terminal domain-containing protein n=1 Tax=Deinococcus peraridilitoris (strain DSM 19664 / LMG 22246 / CIP 109416 / KR-200) TaxID=937777 RepID=L0A331_DEIPD|nr:helicase-associated domain-containing protein [Deinococcus peraridilitoris]AFZ68246.1 hypothetical protein Deipe_2782 [Deinococcus peraridilitoris DSM 19664]
MTTSSGERLTLDFALERMPHEQLRAALKRFAPQSRLIRTAEMKQAVRDVVSDPDRLGELMSRLSPCERFLLGELRRAGGAASGWDLILAAAAQGFAPGDDEVTRVYNRTVRDRPGPRYLWPLIRDGLLLPASDVNSWVLESAYAETSAAHDMVYADARLLNALPDEQPGVPEPLRVPTAPIEPGMHSPVILLLELAELYGRLFSAGSLPLTQQGTANRTAVRRLLKGTPLHEDDFELLVMLLALLGLVRTSSSAITPDPRAWAAWNELSMSQKRRALTEAYLAMPGDAESGAGHLTSAPAARRALLQGLALLPGTTERETFLAAMYDRLGRLVNFDRWTVYGLAARTGKPLPDVPMPDWFRLALAPNGPFVRLGLARVRDDGKKAFVAPGPMLSTLRGQEEGSIAGPVWLAQPNFELLVYLDHLSPPALRTLGAAEAVRFDAQTALYRLTRDSVYRALEAGQDVQELLDDLERFSAVPLGAALRATLLDWAARRERLSVTLSATLVEYPTSAERDAALQRGSAGRARALGERFMLLAPGARGPKGAVRVSYDEAPARSLRFFADGRFQVLDADLALRALLATISVTGKDGKRAFVPARLAGTGPGLLETLERRAQNAIPRGARAMLSLWTGASAPPALAEVSVLQHSDAAALAEHPQVRPLVEGALGANLLLVKAGRQADLRAALQAMEVTVSAELQLGAEQATQTLTAAGGELQHGLDTRRTRVLIESAIERGKLLSLVYREERLDSWSYTRTMGRQHKAVVRPLRVYRLGSTPYVEVEDPDDGERDEIRIGYILGIGELAPNRR